ncbi:hypothetical protein AM588_10000264 [Phytophthora nicotianae]|nr:hypothetical protein AM588_10000264 [Phytophthora nicotianae]
MFMVLFHGVSAVFLILNAKLYWIMENEYIDYFTNLLAPAQDRHFQTVGAFLCVLGIANGMQLVSHVGSSILKWNITARPLGPSSRVMAFCASIVNKIVSTRNEEINGNLYGRVFAIRKIVEIATQVPGTYLYSTLIARPWINHVKVAFLVLNCWSSFVVYQMITKPNRVGTEVTTSGMSCGSARFVAEVVDVLLAAATGMLLPSAIFVPYLMEFNINTLDFPDTMLYDDAEFVNLVLENRAFFAISWGDAVTKIVPHVSVFVCLVAIGSILESEVLHVKDAPSSSPLHKVRSQRSNLKVDSHSASKKASKSCKPTRRFDHIYRLVVRNVFLVTGVIVTVLHFIAQYSTTRGDLDLIDKSCLQKMHPWFSQNYSCTVVKYNCYALGVASPPSDALGWLEREALRTVVFMHCSGFVMPESIREFPLLMGIELWNTTIVRWGEESALSAELHPVMLFMIMSYVNMTEVPTGILPLPSPARLTDLEFSHTNLTALPDSVADSWSMVEILYLEHSLFEQFPSVVMKIPVLSELSLIDNKIESMPGDSLVTAASTYFYDLALSRNPLQELPDARSETFEVSLLSLEFTQITELPSWVYTSILESVSLGGSPMCEEGRNVSLTSIEVCGQDENSWDPLGGERFPIQLVQQLREF